MSPQLTTEPALIPEMDPDTIDLLTPEDPTLQREMASFHANALLRHLITLTAAHQDGDAA